MTTTFTARQLYASYVAAAQDAKVEPKAFTSFKNKDAIVAATKEFAPAPKNEVTLSGRTKELTVSLSKVQRALGRRWCERFGIERPDRWTGAKLPVEMLDAMGV
jgi:hypothetical protein